MVTIFDNIFSKQPQYIQVDEALSRIKLGYSSAQVMKIQSASDKKAADKLKAQLPAVCFSGTFKADRQDADLIEHSGFLVLDFDNVPDIEAKAGELFSQPFVYAGWISPRGNGLKVLVRIADGRKHREHFAALKELFPEVDKSGVNESRVCYESSDPGMYINRDAVPFTKLVQTEKVEVREVINDDLQVFKSLIKWLSDKRSAFVSGERNLFIFKLAAACCRFGLDEQSTANMIMMEYPVSNDFTAKECGRAIHSAYRANKSSAGTAQFDRGKLIDQKTRSEVKIDHTVYDKSIRAKDVIFGGDVKAQALAIRKEGFIAVPSIGVPDLDLHFKLKRGETTCLTGIGNYGKSAWLKWYLLFRVVVFGEKFAVFGPEDNPPEEFYHDFVEIYLGCNCTPTRKDGPPPSEAEYSAAYDFISKHIFYVYPKELAPTPVYVKEVFLELIIKEGVDGIVTDPWNQMAHDYSGGGRGDQYLETTLGDMSRFAQTNNVYNIIVAHPTKLRKQENNNYPCPDVFDLNGGAMWNNKMDNIIVYHRPHMQTSPMDPTCEFHSKKIKRQKIVGIKGWVTFKYIRETRRFEFNETDHLAEALRAKDRPRNGMPNTFTPPVPIQSTKPEPKALDMSQWIDPNHPKWEDTPDGPF